jgi:hypothetical protein
LRCQDCTQIANWNLTLANQQGLLEVISQLLRFRVQLNWKQGAGKLDIILKFSGFQFSDSGFDLISVSKVPISPYFPISWNLDLDSGSCHSMFKLGRECCVSYTAAAAAALCICMKGDVVIVH